MGKKLKIRSRYSFIRISAIIGLAAGWAVALGGCGSSAAAFEHAPLTLGVSTDGSRTNDGYTTRQIVLNWGGGTSRIYPDQQFSALDLSQFRLVGGGTLGSRSAEFREAVRRRVADLLRDLPGLDVQVTAAATGTETDAATGSATAGSFVAESAGGSAAVVFLVQSVRPDGDSDAGEGEFDPCDAEPDSEALVFGEQLRRLIGTATWDEWLLAFANVAAHELGHTLGFEHVPRGNTDTPERPLFVDLMLEGHTADELTREQRFGSTSLVCAPENAS